MKMKNSSNTFSKERRKGKKTKEKGKKEEKR